MLKFRGIYLVNIITLTLAFWVVVAIGACIAVRHASAERLMCGSPVPYGKTLTISIDPDLSPAGLTHTDVQRSIDQWNTIWLSHHGFPIFTPHYGDWQSADILLTAHGYSTTWVHTSCHSGFVQRGNNRAVVFLGSQTRDNATWVTHELGHALGLSDHITPADLASGLPYINSGTCDDGYLGVMSYCASPQMWLMDIRCPAPFRCDGDMVADYYRRP